MAQFSFAQTLQRLLAGKIWRALAVLLMGLVIAGCDNLSAGAAKADATQVLDDQEIIALIDQNNPTKVLKQGAAAQGFVLREDVVLDGLGLRMLRFTFPEPLTGKDAIEILETLDPSSTAGVNHIYRANARTGVEGLDFAQAMVPWPDGGCRARAPIGMIDTSVDAPAIRAAGGRVVTQDFLRGRGAITRHGTDVASVLIDKRRVSRATLYSASVIGKSAQGSEVTGVDSILKGLAWLADNDVRLVNMSLSGPYNKLLDKGVTQAINDGMTVVAAVGNDGATAGPRYPAALDGVIAVTAVDANRNVFGRAGRGAHVDVAAPGVDVMVSLNSETRFVSGTSMAAPFVTARIATDPALSGRSPAAIRAALMTSSDDLGPKGSDWIFGAGLLRAPQSCAR